MFRTNCPACGAEMVFQSAISTNAVCKFCQSVVVRRDVDVEAIGKTALLPQDMSPFQIGTSGTYGKVTFTIAGRLRVGWEDGSWNEWFLHTNDGRKGWLAEAQGTYAISFEMDEVPVALDRVIEKIRNAASATQTATAERQKQEDGWIGGPGRSGFDHRSEPEVKQLLADGWTARDQAFAPLPAPGKKPALLSDALFDFVTVNSVDLRVVDIKRARRLGSEGELPFHFDLSSETTVIDMLGANGEFASLEMGGVRNRFFFGQYVEWEDLKCQFPRIFEGWKVS